MKKIITTAVAASMLLGSTSSAISAQAFDRDAAVVSEAEGAEGSTGIIAAVIGGFVIIGAIVWLEKDEDQDLPTSP